MNEQAVVAASAEQVSCDLQGEVAILSMTTSTYYGLNPVAARIWEWMQHPIRVAELRDNITGEYDVTPDRATADLAALLADLERHQLVTIVDGAAA